MPSPIRTIPRSRARRAFTLIEMMVAMAVFVLLMTLLLTSLDQTTRVIRQSTSKIEAFQNARSAFDTMGQTLSQAALATYWDYQYDPQGNPLRYRRMSNLHFLTGAGLKGVSQAILFQAPAGYSALPASYAGLSGLLNTCGFYVDYNNDSSWKPSFAGSRYRYRLMQVLQPAESNRIYKDANWYLTAPSFPVAENIIALIVRPMLPDAAGQPDIPRYDYDSRLNSDQDPQPVTAHQLPPVVQLTMVAIDEASAARQDTDSSTQPEVITTALSGLFSNPTRYDDDLASLEQRLSRTGINFRIFSMEVFLRESRWSL